MIFKKSLIGIILPLLITLLLCQEVVFAKESVFDQANLAFSQDDFDKAISLYHSVIDNEGISASLFFNLANSYAQKGDTGNAVLYYERALRLDPRNADVLKNLNFLRQETGLFVNDPTSGDTLLQFLTLNQWTIASLILLFLTTGVVLFWPKVCSKNPAKRITITGCLIFFLLACSLVTQHNYEKMPSYVVIQDNIPMRISPFEGSESKGLIKEGRLVSIRERHKNFVYIEDETGRNGWLTQEELAPIVE